MGSAFTTVNQLTSLPQRTDYIIQLPGITIMESFICFEEIDQIYSLNIVTQNLETQATVDTNLLQDQRVMGNMLTAEQEHKVIDYCGTGLQREVAPHMRKIVTDWMMEVCEDQQCQPQIFFLAVFYMDRVLSTLTIKKNQFQLLAAVCILLASKFSQVVSITSEQLVIYTDNSVSKKELLQWEIMVLEVLKWEISTPTVNCFLNLLYSSFNVSEQVQRQAEAIAALAITEYKFLMAKDSVLAASALATALKEELGNSEELLEIIAVMASSLKSSLDDIFVCMCHLVSEHSCHQDIKSQCLKEDRPTTPDDVLNISQSEIIV